MKQHMDLLFLIAGFMVRALAGRKLGIWEEKIFDQFVNKVVDPFTRRYIINRERTLAIWLHHKLGHHGNNSLHCEVGSCAKVAARPRS